MMEVGLMLIDLSGTKKAEPTEAVNGGRGRATGAGESNQL